jgi:PadR family transcriptional regulator, regulatory protein PadR
MLGVRHHGAYPGHFRPIAAGRGGSLYPALHRMEQDGWVRAEWGKTEKEPRSARFYSITSKGRRQLEDEQRSWQRLKEGVARVLAEAQ